MLDVLGARAGHGGGEQSGNSNTDRERKTGKAIGDLCEEEGRQGGTDAHEEELDDVVRLGEDAGDGEEADADDDADGDEGDVVARVLQRL